MTEAKTPRKPKARAKPKRPDPVKLRAALNVIDALAMRDFAKTVELLTVKHGLNLRETAGGVWKATMLAVTVQTTWGAKNALRAWAAKARRELLSGEE